MIWIKFSGVKLLIEAFIVASVTVKFTGLLLVASFNVVLLALELAFLAIVKFFVVVANLVNKWIVVGSFTGVVMEPFLYLGVEGWVGCFVELVGEFLVVFVCVFVVCLLFVVLY